MDHISVRLADAELNAPPVRLGLTVHQQARNRVELVAEVETHRTDGRLIPEPRPHRVAEIVQPDVPAVRPDVSAVEEQHRAEVASNNRAGFRTECEQAVASNGQSPEQRTYLVGAPPADA